MRKPNNIMQQQTRLLRERLWIRGIEIPYPYKIFVTKTDRGRHSLKNKNITVPLWAYEAKKRGFCKHEGNPDYAIYYACHEMAHILAPNEIHGPHFMAQFRLLCPEELQRFELKYKPRNAKAAGIGS